MAGTPGDSTVPRRQLGRLLREARNDARMTVRAAAESLECSDTKIWRIETGQVGVRVLEVDLMCRLYGCKPGFVAVAKGLAKESKAKGWWHVYGAVIPASFDVYMGLEGAASEIDGYEPELVPGLFQTADYARTVMRDRWPDQDPEETERRVMLRMRRQSLLYRPVDPPSVSMIVNEAVLRRPFGGPTVMAAQCRHLLEVSELPHVRLRVVPFAVGSHLGTQSGEFVIMRFPIDGNGRPTEPTTVFVQAFIGSLYLDKPHEAAAYETILTDINRRIGDETGERSRALIHQIAKEHGR